MKVACTVWLGAKGVKASDLSRLFLNSEYSAKYLQQLWKKVRKRGGLCTGITRNVVDLLQNYTATTMLAIIRLARILICTGCRKENLMKMMNKQAIMKSLRKCGFLEEN